MGNHKAGHAMVLAATIVEKRRLPTDTALGLLQEICADFKGCDAEFDDDMMGPDSSALARLATEAFAPDFNEADDGPDDDAWYERVYRKFSEEFNFC